MNMPALPALPGVPCPGLPGNAPKAADEPGAARFAQLLEHAREGQPAQATVPEATADAHGPRAAPKDKPNGKADAGDAAIASRCDGESETDVEAASDTGAPDTRPRLRASGHSDRAGKDMPRASAVALLAASSNDRAAADACAPREADPKQADADSAALLPPGMTCALPLPPVPDKATGAHANGADGTSLDERRKTALRGLERAAFAHDANALRREARAANEAVAASTLTVPAQDAAPAHPPTAAALEAATPRAREIEPGSAGTVLAALAPAASTSVPRSEAAATTAHVAAPLDTPAFAPALAAQVRWLAQERVQQAQITLNPAGMGPVAVQIVIDGANARVDFGADLAATRHAIEASLPVLAAALDESGLKLSGGGVHDGGTRQQPAWASPSPRASNLAAESDKGVRDIGAPVRASVGRGLVDLVA